MSFCHVAHRTRFTAVAASLLAAAVLAGCTGGHPSDGITDPSTSGTSPGSSGSQAGCSGVALTLGGSISTSLSRSTCVNGVPFQDTYTLADPANTPLELSVGSSAFPLHLSIVDQTGQQIADTSFVAGQTAADLRLLVPASQYRITITSAVANTGGIYSLNAVPMSEDVADCTRVFVAPGTVTHQRLLPTDCRIGTAEGDQYLLHLGAAQSVKIVWDDYSLGAVQLRVLAPNGSVISSGVAANPSTTTITASQSGYYVLQFSYAAGGTANYEFAIH